MGLLGINHFLWGGSYRPEAYCEAEMDKEALRFHLWCLEPSPQVKYYKTNDPVYLDSCLEVFLNPWPSITNVYLNLEMNAVGTLLLQKGPSREGREFLQPTLDNYPCVRAGRISGGWEIWLTVPIVFLNDQYSDVPLGARLTPIGNFYQCCGEPNERYACWARIDTERPDFHRPEFFQSIPFAETFKN